MTTVTRTYVPPVVGALLTTEFTIGHRVGTVPTVTTFTFVPVTVGIGWVWYGDLTRTRPCDMGRGRRRGGVLYTNMG